MSAIRRGPENTQTPNKSLIWASAAITVWLASKVGCIGCKCQGNWMQHRQFELLCLKRRPRLGLPCALPGAGLPHPRQPSQEQKCLHRRVCWICCPLRFDAQSCAPQRWNVPHHWHLQYPAAIKSIILEWLGSFVAGSAQTAEIYSLEACPHQKLFVAGH